MTLQQRQEKLMKQISAVKSDEVLTMLEQELSFFIHNEGTDILDVLNSYQTNELISLFNEPSEKDIVDESTFKNATKKWRLK